MNLPDILWQTPCVVTKELVEEVANSNKEVFYAEGEVCVPKVLFYLGFDITNKDYNRNYYTVPNVLVRNNKSPSMVYRTTLYNGQLRNELKEVDEEGNFVYTNIPHRMSKLYEQYEQLGPENLDGIEMESILGIGEEKHYRGW